MVTIAEKSPDIVKILGKLSQRESGMVFVVCSVCGCPYLWFDSLAYASAEETLVYQMCGWHVRSRGVLRLTSR